MSNGDDVLDNWEEIDEAELTNKLQKLEKELKIKEETKLEEIQEFSDFVSTEDTPTTTKTTTSQTPTVPGAMKLLQRAAQTKLPSGQTSAMPAKESPLDSMQSTFHPVVMVLHKDRDEYQSANYTQPINTQTVKILRRPTQSSEPRNNGVRPRQPIKTLQQREQEYAEARLRILGSAKNPEDDAAANATPTTSASVSPATTTVNTTTSTTTGNNTQAKTNAPIRTPQPLQQQQPQPQQMQQPLYGIPQNPYNNFYQQQQQNLYYQKQQLQHSISSPTFSNNRIAYPTTGLLPTPPIPPANMQHRHPIQQQTWSPVVGGSVSSYTLQRQQQRQHQQQHQHQQQQQQQQQQQHLDIVRTPRGPDGSTGFQMRR